MGIGNGSREYWMWIMKDSGYQRKGDWVNWIQMGLRMGIKMGIWIGMGIRMRMGMGFFLVEGGSFTRNKVGRSQYCSTVDQYHLRRGTPLTPSFSFQKETSV